MIECVHLHDPDRRRKDHAATDGIPKGVLPDSGDRETVDFGRDHDILTFGSGLRCILLLPESGDRHGICSFFI